MKNFPTLKKIFQPFLKTDLPKKINLSVKNQTRCNTPLLLGFNGKIKLSVFSKKSPFSSSLIFRKSQNFRRLKYSKIKGFYLKNQTVCYNQTGRLNTFEVAQAQSGTKKEPLDKALNLNGGNDEARTRDLMRDRHAL